MPRSVVSVYSVIKLKADISFSLPFMKVFGIIVDKNIDVILIDIVSLPLPIRDEAPGEISKLIFFEPGCFLNSRIAVVVGAGQDSDVHSPPLEQFDCPNYDRFPIPGKKIARESLFKRRV